MSDPKLVDCPECAAPALRKQVTAASFKLKGTGWYETDFKNSGKQPEPAKKPKDGSDKAASATASSDTATAKPSASASKSDTPKPSGAAA